jgi:hypothetical protein
VSHIKDKLGDSEEELADSESEGGSNSSDHATSLHEQGHSSLSGNKVEWTEKDEKELNDLLEKDWTTLKFFDDQPKSATEGENSEGFKVEEDVTPLVKDEPVLDKGSVSSGGADAAEQVSELDHQGKTRSHGQCRETICTVTLQSSPSGFNQSTNSRNQSPFCSRCLKGEHELRACPYSAEPSYLLCCER